MTKVSVLGQEPQKELIKKPIEFKGFLSKESQMRFTENTLKTEDWLQIILLTKNYRESEYDLIFAKGRRHEAEESCLYLGHWNDGVV